ncbi:hydroxymethylglutaryl-CoA lyase [Vibrio natriegens]|uniref:hydroxymethylglutaryl-CoA lyase n=1 Tax=Vibrio natriegens NBRC 15636 = ATCC 14048 = DSM 759 TaxID=1219067 RepID=A0AAN0Y5M5_VIBNA|nr:hydroxymethylglutaryl-CoA lyase [Vibrio natriegens]ALR18493.1 hydroxymethylglutaryl-CoA lyase [Vibrio natriegens NBRC 15636 = ATCC 14048 = DSM 759]ANQ14445.1 hydroxymethylglutaryl-CoA lyase [Vibrio natriegens NBRC 15636 = ATCC 14048 = DSM 759]EPM38802.1 hydroxymethylglutaryl-CoA lyase [Vibrio natriegens NBRC 15636 = ATCC 14048 = DSM 759]MDX6028604.1 hydroxymethylglutaryl-CoA lyase [Vibrio natriegens NBRC 15636 = ATCC 14048 = DSM 759]UUI14672.1 hydroxymethylglutaryl-CoA lyase [Vibrio natrieg
MTLPSKVKIVEVGARDGLQNESPVSTSTKVRLINLLSDTGLTHIEAGSFVSPKWVPQMADSKAVMQAISRRSDITYSALVPNVRGFEQALEAGANQIAIFTSCSEGFCEHNINCSIAESLSRFESVMEQAAKHNIPVRGYLSCVIDCPYDGATAPKQVRNVATNLIDMGCYEVSLGDTIGTGTPNRVEAMLQSVLKNIPSQKLAVHFHDTWGQALANIYQAFIMGIETVDSSVAGLGGCPYAHGASGNVATEDVLYLCRGLGIETGVDLELLAKAGWMISEELHRQPTSKVSLALRHRYQ